MVRTFHVASQPEIQPKDIAAIRNKLNVSQAVFAAYLGVRPASVISWEYGTRQPPEAVRKRYRLREKIPKFWWKAELATPLGRGLRTAAA